jgi:hypothetical protein
MVSIFTMVAAGIADPCCVAIVNGKTPPALPIERTSRYLANASGLVTFGNFRPAAGLHH